MRFDQQILADFLALVYETNLPNDSVPDLLRALVGAAPGASLVDVVNALQDAGGVDGADILRAIAGPFGNETTLAQLLDALNHERSGRLAETSGIAIGAGNTVPITDWLDLGDMPGGWTHLCYAARTSAGQIDTITVYTSDDAGVTAYYEGALASLALTTNWRCWSSSGVTQYAANGPHLLRYVRIYATSAAGCTAECRAWGWR